MQFQELVYVLRIKANNDEAICQNTKIFNYWNYGSHGMHHFLHYYFL